MINLTFTGADRYTDVTKLPGYIEVGILYSENTEGRVRYPLEGDIMDLLAGLKRRNDIKVSLHVCGGKARLKLLENQIRYIHGMVDRIQINGLVSVSEINACRHIYKVPIITQHKHQNAKLLFAEIDGHHILADNSGGRGIVPEKWINPSLSAKKYIGYAGGLGPDNIVGELNNIAQIAGNPYNSHYWIDMGTGIRDENDKFSIDKINEVIKKIYRIK